MDLIAGLPEESPADIANTVAFLERNRIERFSVFPLQLLPGSPLREEAAAFGIEADPEPPYRVIRTRTLSGKQIQSYSEREQTCSDEICFDLVQDFQLPDFAALQPSEGLGTPATDSAPVTKMLISQPVDWQHFAEFGAGKVAHSTVLMVSRLAESLASFAGTVEAIWQQNPFSLIMPVFEVTTAAEWNDVQRLCQSFATQGLVKPTVVKPAELSIASKDFPGFIFLESYCIGAVSDATKVAGCDAPKLFLEVSPHLSIADLRTVLGQLARTGKDVRYRNGAFHYLEHLVRQQQAGQPLSMHMPVNVGRIVTLDADGEMQPRLSTSRHLALEIVHMQLLFLRAIQNSREEKTFADAPS